MPIVCPFFLICTANCDTFKINLGKTILVKSLFFTRLQYTCSRQDFFFICQSFPQINVKRYSYFYTESIWQFSIDVTPACSLSIPHLSPSVRRFSINTGPCQLVVYNKAILIPYPVDFIVIQHNLVRTEVTSVSYLLNDSINRTGQFSS